MENNRGFSAYDVNERTEHREISLMIGHTAEREGGTMKVREKAAKSSKKLEDLLAELEKETKKEDTKVNKDDDKTKEENSPIKILEIKVKYIQDIYYI